MCQNPGSLQARHKTLMRSNKDRANDAGLLNDCLLFSMCHMVHPDMPACEFVKALESGQ